MTHLLWVIDWIKSGQGFPCLFHLFTGLYCPGCGGTRAIRYLLRGDVLRSFCFHPFVLYAVLAVLTEFVFWMREMIRAGIKRRKYGEQDAYKRAKERGIQECERQGEEGVSGNSGYGKGFHRRYGRWVLGALWVVGVNWVVKNGFLLAGVDLLVLFRK